MDQASSLSRVLQQCETFADSPKDSIQQGEELVNLFHLSGTRSLVDVDSWTELCLQGEKRVDVSAWHTSLICTSYSAQKAQLGISDHQACDAVRWDTMSSNRKYHSAFCSEQPRLIALPTGRSNDSKFTTSLWGDSHRDHYSGAAVGPGTYGKLDQHFLDPKYKAIHACCNNDLGLPQSLKSGRKHSIPELVHRYSS